MKLKDPEINTAIIDATAKAAAVAAANAAGVGKDIEYIKLELSEIKLTIKESLGFFVTKAEFEPVKRLVYGLVTLILTAVVGALLALILRKQ